jgi:uncharacterized protein (DUF4415 family)
MSISQDRLKQIEAIDDTQIDYSDIPQIDEVFFQAARLIMPSGSAKQPISLRVDEDVLAWFKAQGKGHLSRMNAVLRAYMLTSRSN